jgi:hypothetical protein
VNGKTLQAVLEKDGQFDFRRSAQVVRELAAALHYAHRVGVVHRDVKPANIMLNVRGDPMLMDFGLARFLGTEERLTHDGTPLGTPAYMPPEQAGGLNDQVGPASDQYSLGVVLYELLCGRLPFSGPPAMVISMAINQEPPLPSAANPRVPRDLETICRKAMSKRTQERYPSCLDLAEDLRRWQGGEPIAARPLGPVERFWRWCHRNPAVAGLTAAVFLVLLLGVVVSSSLAAWAIGQRDRANEQRDRADDALAELQRQRDAAHEAKVETEKERARAATAEATASSVQVDNFLTAVPEETAELLRNFRLPEQRFSGVCLLDAIRHMLSLESKVESEVIQPGNTRVNAVGCEASGKVLVMAPK